MTIAREHLEGGEVGERDANGLGRIEAIRNRHEKTRGPNGILRVTADHAEIGHDLSLARRGHAGASLLDNAHQFIAWRERQRSLEVGVAATPNEAVGETGPGRENLDAHLAGTGIGDHRLFRQLQDLGASEAGYANVL